MPRPLRIALLGFSAFERTTLSSSLRLGGRRDRSYEPANSLDDCDLVLADADLPWPARAVAEARRMADTVFVGLHPPPGATAATARPIDALQVLRALDQLTRDRPAPPPLPAAPPPLPQALLVDDSPIALRFLETRLQALGLATQRAADSTEALALLAATRYDFVFIDVELGQASALDGLLLCQLIRREARPEAPPPVLVIVSAHDAEIDRVRGTMAGCDAYLGKPLDSGALAALLRQHGVRAPRTDLS